jgi:hypothetical protein
LSADALIAELAAKNNMSVEQLTKMLSEDIGTSYADGNVPVPVNEPKTPAEPDVDVMDGYEGPEYGDFDNQDEVVDGLGAEFEDPDAKVTALVGDQPRIVDLGQQAIAPKGHLDDVAARQKAPEVPPIVNAVCNSLPQSLKSLKPEQLPALQEVIKDVMLAIGDSMVETTDDEGETQVQFNMPAILPKYAKDARLIQFPVVLPIDVNAFTEKVGNETFINFVKSFTEKAVPLFTQSLEGHFDAKFKELDQSIVGSIIKSDTGYLMEVMSISQDLKTVNLSDTEFNELDSDWETTSNVVAVPAHVFRQEYEHVCRNTERP